jgi:DNA-directed RNA polymerase specialized sigma24 family protein
MTASTLIVCLRAAARRLVELREFGALSIEEAAEILGMYTATVERQWSTARAWLRRELSR